MTTRSPITVSIQIYFLNNLIVLFTTRSCVNVKAKLKRPKQLGRKSVNIVINNPLLQRYNDVQELRSFLTINLGTCKQWRLLFILHCC